MNETTGRWDMLSAQLGKAAAKAGAPLHHSIDSENAVTGQDADTWPCWVPTPECLTLSDGEDPLRLASR